MSTGLVICSVCNREVHQDGNKLFMNGWRHCEDGSVMCADGQAIYPKNLSDIKGVWCGKDGARDLNKLFAGIDPATYNTW